MLEERPALAGLQAEIERAAEELGEPWEVVWVDDGSRDGTGEELERIAASRPHTGVVRLRRNFGKSLALKAGWDHTSGDVVVTLDGDGQDDPAEIPGLVRQLREGGYDLVSGWKRERQDPRGKRWASRFFNAVTARLSGIPLHDMNCGLKVYRGDSVRALELYGEQHRFIPVLGEQRGWKIGERPVRHRPREQGRSKFGVERYARGLFDLLTVLFLGRYQYRPLHLFGGAGLLSMLIGLAICAYLTILKLSGSAIGRRPLLLLGILLIVVGVQLLTLGLVGELIAATRQDIRGQRRGEMVDRFSAPDQP